MSPIVPTRIILRDFCLYENVEVDLDNVGLVLVSGVNKDTKGAVSNGSGKTTLFKGIGWTLFGESIDGKRGDEVVRAGNRQATGIIRFSDGHVFERTRKKATPSLSGVDPLGNPIDKKQAQATIERLIGMDWLRFRNTVLFGQGDSKRFLSPETSDPERKSLLQSVVGTSVFDAAHEIAKADLLVLKREVESLEAEIALLETKIETLDLPGLERDHSKWETDRAAAVKELLAEARAELESDADHAAELIRLRSELKDARLEADALAPTLERLERLRSDLGSMNSELASCEARRVAVQGTLKMLLHRLEHRRVSKTCPVCNSDWSKGAAALHLKEANAESSLAKSELERLLSERNRIVENIHDEKLAISELESQINSARDAHESCMELENEIRNLERSEERVAEAQARAKTLVAKIKKLKAEANPWGGRLKKAKIETKAAKLTLGTKRPKLEDALDRKKYAQFWAKGLSPEGLPSWALDSVMPRLTAAANGYLEQLSDGDVTITFDTQMELKSTKGAIRDRINIDWTIEGIPGMAPSGGQWRKMEIATDLAFMDLACDFGINPPLMLLDEVFDNLDAEGEQRVIALLKSLRSKRPSIFVISHDERIKESFEHELTFVKKNNVSKLRKAV